MLPRLGVFQGGAFGRAATCWKITGMAKDVWPDLRRQLEAAALIEAETVPGVGSPFLRFHPTLAPMLWEQLGPDERARLTTAHRQRYYGLAKYLYQRGHKNPHRRAPLRCGNCPTCSTPFMPLSMPTDPDAVDLRGPSVTWFLNDFGLKREAERLTARVQAVSERPGLAGVVPGPVAARRAVAGRRTAWPRRPRSSRPSCPGSATPPATIGRRLWAVLGRCFRAGGRPDLAAARHREGIAVTEKLEQSDEVKRLKGTLHTDLADVLT